MLVICFAHIPLPRCGVAIVAIAQRKDGELAELNVKVLKSHRLGDIVGFDLRRHVQQVIQNQFAKGRPKNRVCENEVESIFRRPWNVHAIVIGVIKLISPLPHCCYHGVKNVVAECGTLQVVSENKALGQSI